MKIILVVGARPNYMKVAPILRTLKNTEYTSVLVHTEQHYDYTMSDIFFKTLGIKEPEHRLGIGSNTPVAQIANTMIQFEKVCLKERPDLIVVVGDVNSTLAAGLTARKLNIRLAHIEAGLRSFDQSMPEETNRILVDHMSDFLFVSELSGVTNLKREGLYKNLWLVGNVLIDNLHYQLKNIEVSKNIQYLKSKIKSKYICVTLHRPSNVDNKNTLAKLLKAINYLSKEATIIFPCHPRTRKKINEFSIKLKDSVYLMKPLSYNDFLYLWKDASLVLTDSGGLQEETTALKVPCLTLRSNTERPTTVTEGSNVVVGTDYKKIIDFSHDALNGKWKKSVVPHLWDGKTSDRIINVLKEAL